MYDDWNWAAGTEWAGWDDWVKQASGCQFSIQQEHFSQRPFCVLFRCTSLSSGVCCKRHLHTYLSQVYQLFWVYIFVYVQAPVHMSLSVLQVRLKVTPCD